MTDVWPREAFDNPAQTSDESLRPFHCVLLMPFSPRRFEVLARELERIVSDYTQAVLPTVQIGPAKIERLDWVDSAGTVQNQLWDRIANADLIFCDLTGQNPNVMFEAGVCAARKRIEQVIFLRDAFYRPDQPFDIAPFRYVQYEMTSDGKLRFEQTVNQLLADVIIRFPDRRFADLPPIIDLPLELDFTENKDDNRLVTPPLSHRRVRAGYFEFGSLWSFLHSWATSEKTRFATFAVELDAKFVKVHPVGSDGYIGVGFRSHHPFAPFGHIVYLKRDGSVLMCQPDDDDPNGFKNVTLRSPQPIDLTGDHQFKIVLNDSELTIAVDACRDTAAVADLPKLLSPGLIRFQAHLSWMGIRKLSLK